MNHYRLRASALLFAVILFAGAAHADDPKKPRVEMKRVKINRVDLPNRTADVTVSVEIENPGSSFRVKDVKYKLKLNGEEAAAGKYKQEIKVPSASTVTIDVPLTVNLIALPVAAFGAVSEGFVLRYELETEFTVPIFAFYNRKVKSVFAGDMPLAGLLSAAPPKQ